MKRILKVASIVAVVASSAICAPMVGAFVGGAVVGAVATQSQYVYTNPAVVTTVHQPIGYSQTTTVLPGMTVSETTTYVRPVTVVQPASTVIYQTTNPVVVVY